MIQGYGFNLAVAKRVLEVVRQYHCVLLPLDSNHAYEHVLVEINLFASLVSVRRHFVPFDTVIDNLPKDFLMIDHVA